MYFELELDPDALGIIGTYDPPEVRDRSACDTYRDELWDGEIEMGTYEPPPPDVREILSSRLYSERRPPDGTTGIYEAPSEISWTRSLLCSRWVDAMLGCG